MPHLRSLSTRWRRWRVWILPLLLLLTLTLPHLVGGRWSVDMGLYAGVSLQAFRTGEFWTLHAGDRLYFNKPPLGFWVHGAFLHVLGSESWAVRLPVIGAAAGCVLATVALVRRLHGARAGLMAVLALAGTVEFFRLATQFTLDYLHTMLLLLATLGVVAAVCRATEDEKDRGRAAVAMCFALSGVAVGLALLTKPFFALGIYPLLAGWLLVIGRGRLAPWLLASTGVALAIAAPWHVSMALTHGRPFLDEYLGRQILERATGDGTRSEPWWYYLRLLAETYWPWLAALAGALWLVASGRAFDLSRGRGRLGRAGVWLALLWAAGWLLALSTFPDKRRPYLLVAYPGLAWLGALWLVNAAPHWLRRGRGRAWLDPIVLGAFVLSLVVTTARLPPWREPIGPEWPALRSFLERERPAEIWAGSVHYSDAGMLYAMTGLWPRTIRWRDDYRTPPPAGALVLYSESEPPRGATEVFRHGKVAVVRWPAGMGGPHDHDAPPLGAPVIVR